MPNVLQTYGSADIGNIAYETMTGGQVNPGMVLDEALVADLKRRIRSELSPRFVPDEIVQMLTASGTPAEARSQVRHYIENGATCPILYPLGDVKAMIDAFSGWNGTT